MEKHTTVSLYAFTSVEIIKMRNLVKESNSKDHYFLKYDRLAIKKNLLGYKV